jgi:hypothetical protein
MDPISSEDQMMLTDFIISSAAATSRNFIVHSQSISYGF